MCKAKHQRSSCSLLMSASSFPNSSAALFLTLCLSFFDHTQKPNQTKPNQRARREATASFAPLEMMIVERVITVEYLDPSMAQELLGKFPDPSAFDFDYSQSGIWSPLLPRGRYSSSSVFPMESPKKLSNGSGILSPGLLRKVKGKMIKKHKKKTIARKRLDFSPSPASKKGWNKALRAVMKRFKLHRSPLQMMLPAL